ncbi:unnamed protein product [Ilex paraguariensis]|uniref:Uncharacterized protein n=1 Tax=Ilex paraguariensis TaxID=185542 RepID=A0ABC8S522_9AQUA
MIAVDCSCRQSYFVARVCSGEPENFGEDDCFAFLLGFSSYGTCVIWGIETLSTTIEWIMSEMMRNPRAMEKAQAEVRKK